MLDDLGQTVRIVTHETWQRMRHLALLAALPASVWAQTNTGLTTRLQTADTEIVLEAGESTPRFLSLDAPGQPKWENSASEALPEFVEITGRKMPVYWRLDRNASRSDGKNASFVYESATPRLRLTWLWRVPVAYGPIEHKIRIENLDSQELWIPMQDSFAFNWQIEPH